MIKCFAGPPRIPLVGSYIFLLLINSAHLHKAALLLSKWYKSNIIGIFIGSVPTIISHDPEGVKEILNRQEFDGRPQIYAAKLREPINEKVRGIFFTHGWKWKEQRRFVLRNLRDWGFGCRSGKLEMELRDEICTFVEMLHEGPKYPHEEVIFNDDGSVHCPSVLFATLSNAFFEVLYGERLHRKDQAKLYEYEI